MPKEFFLLARAQIYIHTYNFCISSKPQTYEVCSITDTRVGCSMIFHCIYIHKTISSGRRKRIMYLEKKMFTKI